MGHAAGRLLIILAVSLTAGCVTDRPAPVVDRSIGLAQRQPQRPPSDYQVERGDTLYSIAFRYGLDAKRLARWNGIDSPYTIYPGQRLRLREGPGGPAPGRTTPAARAGTGVTTEPLAEAPGGPDDSRERDRETAPEAAPETREAPAREPAPPEPERRPEPEPAPEPGAAETAQGPLKWQWPADGPILSTFADGDSSRNGIDIGGQAGAPIRAAAAGEVVYSGSGLIGYGELIIVKHDKALLSAYGHNRNRLVQEGDRVQAGQKIAEMGDTGAPRAMLHFEIREDGSPVNPQKFLPRR